MNSPKQTSRQIARAILVCSYFALFILLMCWYAWLMPSQTVPTFWVLLLLAGPLLIPLRGLLHGRVKSYAWLLYLSLFYFIHGTGELFADPEATLLASLEILFSILLYLSALTSIRLANQMRLKD